jgi:tetratricopeptide (TPR) repeat protein
LFGSFLILDSIAGATQDLDAWFYKGNALPDLNKSDEALTAFDKAIEINPQNLIARDGKGDALVKLGKADEAMKAFDKAIEIDLHDSKLGIIKKLYLNRLNKSDL